MLIAAWGTSAAGLDALQGTWLTRKTNEAGRFYTQKLEFKENTLRFELLDDSDQTRLVAKGVVKAERQGTFQVLSIRDFSAGPSEAELAPAEDGGAVVYMLLGETLYVASNFDEPREKQPPRLDVYQRPGATQPRPTEPDLTGTWKLSVTLDGRDFEYDLKLLRNGPQWVGTVISPRSGPHEIDAIEFKGGALRMLLKRQLDGEDATYTYTGQLDGLDRLSGNLVIRSAGDETIGKWKAAK